MITVGGRTFADVDGLEKLVVHAATMYELNGYVEDFDGVEVTDPEYDDLFRTLKGLKPTSVAFKGTSPSTAKVKGGTVKHDPPMTSISKADGTVPEKEAIYHKWIKDCANRLGVQVSDLAIAQAFKRDGVSIRINYVNGKLHSAGLRPRDGVMGSDVTRHMKYISGVPLNLPGPYTLSLNGEVECWLKDFEAVNAERDAAGEDLYKNPRNYTAGCLGRDDPEENKHARLRVTYHGITGFADWNKFYRTEIERAKWANNKDGLNLNDGNGGGLFVQVRRHHFAQLGQMEGLAKSLPYYTDGVVLKVDRLDYQEELGHVGDDPVNCPRYALAWKYEEETTTATVSRIEWNASRTGRVVPTAIFDQPFILADTENTRATCNNFGWMEKQGLGPGAVVRCKKGGKIIPNIMEVLTPVSDLGAPKTCPSCKASLSLNISSSGNSDLLCPNPDCAAKHLKSWIFFVQNLGGKGIGQATMELILNTGKCRSLADLYDLTEADLRAAGLSEREAILALATIYVVKPVADNVKLRQALDKAKGVKFDIEASKFLTALGIPGVGSSASKAIVQHFKDFDQIRAASVQDLLAVPNIGQVTAQGLHDWLRANAGTLDRLIQNFRLKLPQGGKLSGVNFCLTGDFDLGKKYWEAKIEALGGNIQSSVGKATNYLIQQHGKSDGSPSTKEAKAIELNVPILSIPDLEKLL